MKRFLITPITLFALLVPGFSSAYYSSPSTLLRAIEFDGTPRNFSSQIHANFDDVHFSAWINGSAEGRSAEILKAKFNATVDMHEKGITMRSRYEAIIHEQVVYIRLQSFDGDSAFAIASPLADDLIGKWVAVPVDPELLSKNQNISELSALAEDAIGDDEFTIEQLNEMGKSILDAMISMEKQQFPGGFAFSLKLKQDFLVQMNNAISNMLTSVPIVQNDTSISVSQEMIKDMINFHLKVDTNAAGEFLYGKFYISIEPPDANMKIVMEGKTAAHDSPVYVSVPAEAMSVDELANMLSQLDSGASIFAPTNWRTTDTNDYQPLTRERTSTNSTRSVLPRTNATAKRITGNWDPSCSTADSFKYTFLMRKGLCPMQWDARPGRGSLRSLR